ncbi:hypothetical protein GCM10027093_13700 [Paraburkholderia jirisanensis]
MMPTTSQGCTRNKWSESSQRVFAGILLLSAFALILDALVGVAERRLMKRQPASSETGKL